MLPQDSATGGSQLAQRWRRDVEATPFVYDDATAVQATVTIGVAELSDGMKSPIDLVNAADGALYEAQSKGRTRVEVYENGVCSQTRGGE